MHGKRDAVVGHDDFASRGILDFHYPIGEKGKIVDFESLEDLLSYTAECGLKCDMKGKSVLLCETYNQDREVREREIQILFETFKVDSSYVAVSSILAMYSTGRTSGIILECGAGRTLVIPVYEGYPISSGVVEHCYTGHDMASLLAKKISEHEQNRRTGLDLNNAYGVYLTESAVIEKVVNFAVDDAATGQGSQGTSSEQVSSSTYALPDGKEVYIDETMISECRNMYFSPDGDSLHQEQPIQGIVQHTETCLQKIDVDVRHVGETVVLTGGVTGCKGFHECFVTNIKYLQTRRSFAKSCVSWKNFVNHPCHMAWYGGSILAALQTYRSMWIFKNEYDESGPTIVHRKCF